MKKLALLPLAALALAAACGDVTTPTPVMLEGPSFHHTPAPSSVVLTVVDNDITVTWSAIPGYNGNYGVELEKLDGAAWSVLRRGSKSTLNITFPDLPNGTYRARVAGHIGHSPIWGTSGQGIISGATEKDPQSISFEGIVNKTYGDDPFVVSALATSGLTVTLSVSGPCTIAGTSNSGTVTITGAGSCVIDAEVAGNTIYYPASDYRTVVIARAPLSVTVADQQMYFGQSLPTNEVTYEGFVYEEDESVLEGALSYTILNNDATTATLPLAAGTYLIRASGLTSDNYVIRFEDGTLTVSAWQLEGYHSPVSAGFTYATRLDAAARAAANWNVVRNGSTVPLKFNVYSDRELVAADAPVESFRVYSVACPGTAGGTGEITGDLTTGATTLRYADTQWIQNWQTQRKANTCYEVVTTTKDGSMLVAYFRLK